MTSRRMQAALSGLAVAAALSLGACDQPRNALGTTSSVCFRALAPARAAVHKGTLLGVRKANLDRIHARIPSSAQLGNTTVCLVAYRDHYTPGSVDHQLDQQSGDYAIVAVELKRDTVLASFVTNRLPVRFRHL